MPTTTTPSQNPKRAASKGRPAAARARNSNSLRETVRAAGQPKGLPASRDAVLRSTPEEIGAATDDVQRRGLLLWGFGDFLERASAEEIGALDDLLRLRRDTFDISLQGAIALWGNEDTAENLNLVRVCRRICDTGKAPAERYLRSLLRLYDRRQMLTPDDAAKLLEEFRKDFEHTAAAAREFLRHNPGILDEQPPKPDKAA